MIARIWHGKTHQSNFESYSDFLKGVSIPDYEKTPGFKGLTFLRSIKGNEAHFNLITYWENLEGIINFRDWLFKEQNIILRIITS